MSESAVAVKKEWPKFYGPLNMFLCQSCWNHQHRWCDDETCTCACRNREDSKNEDNN